MVALPSQLSLMLGPALHLSIPPIELHCELYQESGSNCKKKKNLHFLRPIYVPQAASQHSLATVLTYQRGQHITVRLKMTEKGAADEAAISLQFNFHLQFHFSISMHELRCPKKPQHWWSETSERRITDFYGFQISNFESKLIKAMVWLNSCYQPAAFMVSPPGCTCNLCIPFPWLDIVMNQLKPKCNCLINSAIWCLQINAHPNSK